MDVHTLTVQVRMLTRNYRSSIRLRDSNVSCIVRQYDFIMLGGKKYEVTVTEITMNLLLDSFYILLISQGKQHLRPGHHHWVDTYVNYVIE